MAREQEQEQEREPVEGPTDAADAAAQTAEAWWWVRDAGEPGWWWCGFWDASGWTDPGFLSMMEGWRAACFDDGSALLCFALLRCKGGKGYDMTVVLKMVCSPFARRSVVLLFREEGGRG